MILTWPVFIVIRLLLVVFLMFLLVHKILDRGREWSHIIKIIIARHLIIYKFFFIIFF